ncbi:MAG: hypothetical protein EBV40_05485 [Actinobacteria bacterium]|nr:hypothetical protein [Actinomycetota bacterium]
MNQSIENEKIKFCRDASKALRPAPTAAGSAEVEVIKQTDPSDTYENVQVAKQEISDIRLIEQLHFDLFRCRCELSYASLRQFSTTPSTNGSNSIATRLDG